MSIAVTCPSGHLLKIADNMAGRAGRCPFCREIVQVPANGRSSDAEKSKLASRSRLEPRRANPASAGASDAPPINPPPFKSPAANPPVAAPDPSAADTVLMPLSLAEIPPTDNLAFLAEQSTPEPDSPVMAQPAAIDAEPDQMAQTLPLPTAELMPRRSAAAEAAHDLGFDTAGHKTKIVGAWRIIGDVEPPYVPEGGAGRGSTAAIETAEGRATGPADAKAAIRTNPSQTKSNPPPLPPGRPTAAKVESAHARPGSRQSIAGGSRKTSWLTKPIAKSSDWPLRPTVYRIAIGLALVSIFSMWPALRHWDLRTAPGWARGVLLVALLQLAYAAWLVSVPDWASLWSMMIVLAIVATLYGAVAAMALATPMEHDPPLGLQPVRHIAPYWCFVVMLLTMGTAYLCGHASQRIRRTHGKA